MIYDKEKCLTRFTEVYKVSGERTDTHEKSMDGNFIIECGLLFPYSKVLSGMQNLWCAAVFTGLADRKIIERQGEWISVPQDLIEKHTKDVEIFRFIPVSLYADRDGRVLYEESERSSRVFRFQVVDKGLYPQVMTSVTAHLMGSLGEGSAR